MSIKQLEFYHGSVLCKITRNKKNKISLIEWDEKQNRSLYKIETENSKDLKILIRYDATARPVKRDKALHWDFTTLTYQENCYFCLVCIEEKIIYGDTVMEICAISPEKLLELFDTKEREEEQQISCIVKFEKGKSFRVTRKQKDIELVISRNQIDKI